MRVKVIDTSYRKAKDMIGVLACSGEANKCGGQFVPT